MTDFPDFEINSSEEISKEFLSRNIFTFKQAALFVSQLPYGRNKNKNNLPTIFTDNCGTCSTKHALLKQLAIESNFNELKLIVGLFKMTGNNTPEVSESLKQYKLDFIPEAHNYLRYKNQIFDYTKANSKPSDFVDDLIEEIEILPNQITEYKVAYHKEYLRKWLENNKNIKLSLIELWEIREQCIHDLAKILN